MPIAMNSRYNINELYITLSNTPMGDAIRNTSQLWLGDKSSIACQAFSNA